MKLQQINESESKEFAHYLATKVDIEYIFGLWNIVRDYMLHNTDKLKIENGDTISKEQIQRGGAGGAIVIVTVPKQLIQEYLDLIQTAVNTGYADPKPLKNAGSSYSILENITNIDNNSVTFALRSWLPDFSVF